MIVEILILWLPVLPLLVAIRGGSWIMKFFLVLAALALAMPGYYLRSLYAVSCSYGLTEPKEPKQTFSAMEMPGKGLTYEKAMDYFESYKKQAGDPNLQACRTCEAWQEPWNYYQWYDYLVHPRWNLPLCNLKAHPNTIPAAAPIGAAN